MNERIRQYLISVITDRRDRPPDRIIKFLLLLISGAYRAAAGLVENGYRKNIFPRRQFECCLISVGNITWGGTGKTPLVKMIARGLSDMGRRVVVVSRGYGGDEDLFLQEALARVPVVVDRNRARACRRALAEFGAEVIILDDGFQQWGLDRDLDIVAVNCSDPFGNGRLLPRGILREPLSALNRANVFFLTRADAVEKKELLRLRRRLRELNSRALIVEAVYFPAGLSYLDEPKRKVEPAELAGRKAALLAGIADPGSFSRLVKNMGMTVAAEIFHPDHHQYGYGDLLEAVEICRRAGVELLAITEKDAVKLRKFWLLARNRFIPPEMESRLPPGTEEKTVLLAFLPRLRVLVVGVETKIVENGECFVNRLLGVVRG